MDEGTVNSHPEMSPQTKSLWSHVLFQEMLKLKDTFRNSDPSKYTYHDKIFDNEINRLVRDTDKNYSNMLYREAVKTGFYDLQAARDHYRDITTVSEGMNWQLIMKFMEVSLVIKKRHYNYNSILYLF